MERSCARDFGKEVGMVHEGLMTLRNFGLTAEGWQQMTQNKELAKKVVELIEGKKYFWFEQILAQERACRLAFFGQEFDLSDFAATLKKYGESRIRFWQKIGLEPHFLPRLEMAESTSFQGWKVKPEQWFYQKIAEGRILREISGQLAVDKGAHKLLGITALIDTRLKPKYEDGRQMYENDNLLGPIIEELRRAGKIADCKPHSSRFSVSVNEWEEDIKPALADKLNLEPNQLRLERVIEANVVPQLYPYMPRKDDGKTNTWVWYEERFEGRGRRLHGGDSDDGGLAGVNDDWADNPWDYGSFRPLAVL